MATFVKLNEAYLNLDHVTDIHFTEEGEAVVHLDTMEQVPCPCEQEHCERMVQDQAFRVFCTHSAAILRAYLDKAAADPRTPVPDAFKGVTH